ncbi:type I restriction endonuclease subunit R [Allorhodopirellula solitaria]|uniref:Type I restriction enzyme endonuclease subunit n=1 Tax=Allorhodopirellula solitaria TaxID=2527987 RepID=A0A5C5X8Q8_9BACT|nr:type I restriction endonuclease subunit R [Allorhodopirellula solitaria]TWT59254.1 Type I restriction enzyme [Allorhodopirellula solitaria]
MTTINEDTVEQAALDWLVEVGFDVIHGSTIAPDGEDPERESFQNVVLEERLLAAIQRLNPHLPIEAVDEAMRKVLRPDLPTLIQNNRAFHQRLRDGVEIEYRRDDGSIAGDHAKLLDDTVSANDFLAVNQFTVTEHGHNRRLDIVLFVNGLPLVIIELKNSADEQATVDKAFAQLQTYQAELPTLFGYNELLVASDGTYARMGSLTAGREWFKPWRAIDSESPVKGLSEIEVLIRGVFDPQRLIPLLRNFVVFEEDSDTGRISKVLAGYHQFHAAATAIESTVTASRAEGSRQCGVVWHTQGSGKSFTMLFYAGLVISHPEMNNPTVIVLTDRNDLDDQLFGQFQRCHDLLRQTPVQADSVEHLRELLQVGSGGVIFTTVHKFAEKAGQFPELSDRSNVVVLADEAHRSQYGFQAKVDKESGKVSYGFARNIRDALPNASFIGFTGTPVELDDKNTRSVFGDYISVYDIQRAVEDKATVPIYYESRVIKLALTNESMQTIDEDFDCVTESAEDTTRERLKTKWAALEAMVGDEDRIRVLAADLVEHFDTRCESMPGKAMVVCMSRRICVDLYNEIAKLRPEWVGKPADEEPPMVTLHRDTSWQESTNADAPQVVAESGLGVLTTSKNSSQTDNATIDDTVSVDEDDTGAVKVIMTGSASDPADWQQHIRTKRRRKELANRFKDPNSAFRIVIVRDMWLTGFDAPCLHTMYLDKPMQGHGLMQAIARVNRVFRDKPGGLVVDYLGIGDSLKAAMRTYTESGGKGKTTIDTTQAVAALRRQYEICSDMLHGFDWSAWHQGKPTDMVSLPVAAQDFLLEDNGKQRWLACVSGLSKAFALCPTEPYAIEIRDDVAFFQTIATGFRKYESSGKSKSELDYAVRQLVGKAVVTTDDAAIDVFSAAGMDKPDLSILSDEFLEEVRRLPYKNVAVELLQKLLNDEIQARSPRNVVQARALSEMLGRTLNAYHNRAIGTQEVLDELFKVCHEVRARAARGEELGLNDDELAFYDALAENDSAMDALGNEKLKVIATELIIAVRKNVTIDWTLRESARAKIRVLIRRILRRHGYPPDMQASATKLVLEQAEAICRDTRQ